MRETIHTARLTLRPFRGADAARVAELAGAWEVARMCARVPHPYAVADAEAWFATQPEARAAGRAFDYAVETAAEGLIGAVGVERRKAGEAPTLGYWIGQPYWGRGYATEAGAALLATAAHELGEADFRSEHFVDNLKSGIVLEKLGFAYTGEVRPMLSLARRTEVPARAMTRRSPRKATP
jgi:RimJ/RimL family protein N-acetyltransferase